MRVHSLDDWPDTLRTLPSFRLLAGPVIQLPDDLAAVEVLVLGHGDTPAFEYEASPKIHRVGGRTIAARAHRDAGLVVECLSIPASVQRKRRWP